MAGAAGTRGPSVVVTRPAAQAQAWVRALCERGWQAWALPLIEIAPARDPVPLQDAWLRLAGVSTLPGWDAVMFVSAAAVIGFHEMKPSGLDWRAGSDAPATFAWVTGPGTAAALRAQGWPEAALRQPPLQGATFDSEALWTVVAPELSRIRRVLILRGADATGACTGRDWLAERLRAAGVSVDQRVAYERHPPQPADDALNRARSAATDGSWWLFSSAEAVSNLCRLLPQQDWSAACAVATHPRIADAARRAGFGRVREAPPRLDDLIASIESFA